MKNLKLVTIFFALLSISWACVEKFDDPANPLIADAGAEQEIPSGSLAVLDGSNSTNSFGTPISYSWKLLEKPNGATVELSTLNQVAVQFSTNTPGEYKFELTVSYLGWSNKDEVIIRVTESAELLLEAIAGEDRTINLGNTIQLDGSLSKNKTGNTITFQWEILQRPEGSTAQLSTTTGMIANFQPDKVGEFSIKLNVKAGNKQSSDLVKIIVLEEISGGDGPIILSEDITVNRTLTNIFVNDSEKLDYLVTKEIAVKGAKLTIEPGVRIGFEEGTGLTIDASGALKAYSMDFTNNPIVFQGKQAIKGYWDGINIYSTQAPEYLNGIEVRDAGKLGYGLKIQNESKIHLERSTIHHNLGIGVWFEAAANLKEFKENHLFDNEISPLRIPARLITELFVENQIKDKNIQVIDGKIYNGAQNYWPKFDVEYNVLSDLTIYNGSTLILAQGGKLNMNNNKAIQVTGGSALKLLGSQANPVKIEGMVKEQGSWKGLYIENSQSKPSTISYAEIQHAGSNSVVGQSLATIKLGNGVTLKMNKTTLNQGKGTGFEALGTNNNLEFTENTIINHLGHPIAIATDLVEKLDYFTIMRDNGINEVAVDGFKPLAKDNSEILWRGFAEPVPYVIKGVGKDLIIQSGMRIREGVTIKMQPSSRIYVQNANGRLGYLSVDGFQGNPVIIKGTNESKGSWYGITYSTNNPQNKINNAIIQHAGKATSNLFSAAVIVDNVSQGSLIIQNTKIAYSGQHGVAVVKQFQDFLKISNLTFEDIAGEEVYIWN